MKNSQESFEMTEKVYFLHDRADALLTKTTFEMNSNVRLTGPSIIDLVYECLFPRIDSFVSCFRQCTSFFTF